MKRTVGPNDLDKSSDIQQVLLKKGRTLQEGLQMGRTKTFLAV